MNIILKLEDELKSYPVNTKQSFADFSCQIKKLFEREGTLTIQFVDMEQELMSVEDKHDLEYMYSNSTKAKPLEVLISIEPVKKIQRNEIITKEDEMDERELNPMNFKLEKADSIETLRLDGFELKKDIDGEFFEENESEKLKELFVETYQQNESNSANVNKKIELILVNKVIEDHPKIKQIQSKIDFINQSLIESIHEIKNDIKIRKDSASSVQEKKTKKVSNVKTVHLNYFCNKCERKEFVGRRYNCLVCKDFDWCEACEEINIHDHPMIRYTQYIPFDDSRNLQKVLGWNFQKCEKNTFEKKIDFLMALTSNKYKYQFYQTFCSNFKSLTLKDFSKKMIEIFY